jgi:hypothetical protein
MQSSLLDRFIVSCHFEAGKTWLVGENNLNEVDPMFVSVLTYVSKEISRYFEAPAVSPI